MSPSHNKDNGRRAHRAGRKCAECTGRGVDAPLKESTLHSHNAGVVAHKGQDVTECTIVCVNVF